MAIVFDTLEYAGRLKRAGFTDQQAQAQVQALAAIVHDSLATKEDMGFLTQDLGLLKQDMGLMKQELTQDMVLLKQELKQDLLFLKQELKHDLRDVEHRLTLRLGTVVSVAVGVVAALVKLL